MTIGILNKIYNSMFFSYVSIIFIATIFGGLVTRIYGNTCGIDIISPFSWTQTLILMGSPYCKTLNYISYASTIILENIWIHFGTIIITCIFKNIPKNISKFITKRSQVDIDSISQEITENFKTTDETNE